MRSKKLLLTKQTGSALLLELAIVAVLGALGASAKIWAERQALLDVSYTAQGTLIKRLRNAADGYQTIYYDKLISGASIDGFANPLSPTIAELKAKDLLPPGFKDTGIFGQPYKVSLTMLPAGCGGAALCENVSGMVYLTQPITDGSGLGTALLEIGADGAYSDINAPNVMNGLGGVISVTNPMGPVPGILGASFGYNTGGNNQFLRRDGTLPMTGSLNLGNQKAIFAKGIYADDVGAAGVLNLGPNIKVGSDASIANGQISSGTAVLESSTAGALLVKGEVRSSGLNVTGNGVFGGSIVANDMFNSYRKQWMSQLSPDIVLKGSQLVDLKVNPNIAKPNCSKPVADSNGSPVDPANPFSTDIGLRTSGPLISSGTPKIYAIPQAGIIGSYTNVKGTLTSVNNPDGSITFTQTIDNTDGAAGLFDIKAVDAGGYWAITYSTRNYSQEAIVLVEVACKY